MTVAERRVTGSSCPVAGRAEMDFCQECRFFRGASSEPKQVGWTVLCNWPRSGSEIVREPVPDVFVQAFEK